MLTRGRARRRRRHRSPGSSRRCCQRSVVAAGRSASDTSASRPCGAGAPSATTSSRAMPMRASSACMANCGWPAAGAPSCVLSSSLPAISAQEASSRSVSRPGSTTAPCGSLAMVASSLAVAGIEPVEPAAITGASLPASRLASASISRSRRSAGSMAPRSRAQRRPGLARDLQEFAARAANRGRDRPAPARRAGPRRTCRVVMSSIRRARSSASAERRRRRVGDQRRAVRRRAPPANSPMSGSARASSSRRSSGAMRRRQSQRGLGQLAGGRFGEGDLVLVDVAERHDARQDRGVAVERVEEHVARQPAGAPRRQIERGARELERIVGWPESRAPAGRRAARRSASAETAPRRGW